MKLRLKKIAFKQEKEFEYDKKKYILCSKLTEYKDIEIDEVVGEIIWEIADETCDYAIEDWFRLDWIDEEGYLERVEEAYKEGWLDEKEWQTILKAVETIKNWRKEGWEIVEE